eukprot:TRINITY_DN4629_c0_g1_i2.p1 TRINITY_DN4629_c0_g1~~TRINITY_DN4629_c0_g1_i2.p1  ORF type:complete len:145 (-),score=17.45 TRINITY_DN4629_c0_g1_i2:54-488(-)
MCIRDRFITGWLLCVDGAVIGNKWAGYHAPPWFMFLPGIVSTFTLVMTNLVSVNDIHPFSMFFSEDISRKVRVWLLISFSLSFGAIIAIVWMMITEYQDYSGNAIYPGVAMILQNVCILISSLLFLMARQVNEELEYDALSTGM